jgi:hypothetical protein
MPGNALALPPTASSSLHRILGSPDDAIVDDQ